MSANGLEVFDKTLETTHIWLKEIMADIPNYTNAQPTIQISNIRM